MLIAITRAVNPAFDPYELTHLNRQPIDVPPAQRQHHAYQQALQAHGIAVTPVDVSEVVKAEGGVTCCSLIFDEAGS
jgi:N-dimethylarginine dimethylaminohydrolase